MADARTGGADEIAVVGRGFSGMMVAIAMLRRCHSAFSLCLYDPQPLIEAGDSVTGPADCEILNSRVRDLSADPQDGNDFARWLEADEEFRRAVPAAIPGFPHLFVPKSVFRRYVLQRFSESLSMRPDVAISVSGAQVAAVRPLPDHLELTLSGAHVETAKATHLVLATGFGVGGRVRRAVAPYAPDARVAILGSGIRAVDRLLCLRERGHGGEILLVSENRFLPQSHTLMAAEPGGPPERLPTSPRLLLRALREAAAAADDHGGSWQGVLNAMRPLAPEIWAGMSEAQRRQFQRHVQPIYESHRNRLPPPHHARLQRELENPATRHLIGRIAGVSAGRVTINLSGERDQRLLEVDAVHDERPPETRILPGLLQGLIGQGLALPDPAGRGLSVGETGGLLTPAGPSERVYAIGPITAGALPDADLAHVIVQRAFLLADRLAEVRV